MLKTPEPLHALHAFDELLDQHGLPSLTRREVEILQINVGRYCNQACAHCHVEAGPLRKEKMTLETARRILDLATESPSIHTMDLTGGAPELHEVFRPLVEGARRLGIQVIDRCNLTVLFEPGQEDLADYLAAQQVQVVASLPCYCRANVDKQRGKGVFDLSIRALQRLNELGYGVPGSGLELDLVFNPQGASLPPPQAALEAEYKQHLAEDFGIRFNRLFSITNMPIKRFREQLRRAGKEAFYMDKLEAAFNPDTVPQVMCRNLLSVSWDGRLFDCDFNQMLDLPVFGEAEAGSEAHGAKLRPKGAEQDARREAEAGAEAHGAKLRPKGAEQDARREATVWTTESFDDFAGSRIATGDHCLGCTAGCGSSCSGSLT